MPERVSSEKPAPFQEPSLAPSTLAIIQRAADLTGRLRGLQAVLQVARAAGLHIGRGGGEKGAPSVEEVVRAVREMRAERDELRRNQRAEQIRIDNQQARPNPLCGSLRGQ